MKILWVTDSVPDATIGGAPALYHHLMTRVSRHHRVSLVSIVRSPGERAAAESLRSVCARVETVLLPVKRPGGLRTLAAVLAAGAPPLNRGYWSREVGEAIRAVCRDERVDLVQIEHAHMAQHVWSLPARVPPRRVLVLHNVGRVLFGRIARTERRPRARLEHALNWALSPRWETRMAREFDACVTLSEHDRRLLDPDARSRCHVVPHGVDTDALRPLPARPASQELLMVGNMGYGPNHDAVLYFCESVLPLIRKAHPDVRLTIVGKDPPAGIEGSCPAGALRVTGFVHDVTPYYDGAALLIVPLRAGSGVRGKCLEAMALGRPVVSTSIGCEGLGVTDGREILLADDHVALAAQVDRLLRDPELAGALTRSARRYVERNHSWETSAASLLKVYEAACGRSGSSG